MSFLFPTSQLLSEEVFEAIQELSMAEDLEQRGAVFTKREVVDAILDLSGYVESAELSSFTLLEPSFGNGDFLTPVIERLFASLKRQGNLPAIGFESLKKCIVAVELHTPTYQKTREKIEAQLLGLGLSAEQAEELCQAWLRNDDFLTIDLDQKFQYVVGNPPYVRQERIPSALLKFYKKRFTTLYDRADLYVLFFERCLDLLCSSGRLGFVCANRWVKNKYGGPLRAKISEGFQLKNFIDLDGLEAFHSEVIAYPAITVIEGTQSTGTLVSSKALKDLTGLTTVVRDMNSESMSLSSKVCVVHEVANGRDPWLLDSPEILRVVRTLENSFPALEHADVRVGIGVASGCDKVFIGDYQSLPVEAERKLPLAMANDLKDGRLVWQGSGIVNPYLESGDLAPLSRFPEFAAYLTKHQEKLKRRHTARKQPKKWYRTIDKIDPGLTSTPKLLIPDIKGNNTVVYDDGQYYPHHNLYVVTSKIWNLKALQTILRSSVALMFVAAYCTKMSGGFLRFQAQYLRRIRVPHWKALTTAQKDQLITLSAQSDRELIDKAVLPLYGLTLSEQQLVQSFASRHRVGSAK